MKHVKPEVMRQILGENNRNNSYPSYETKPNRRPRRAGLYASGETKNPGRIGHGFVSSFLALKDD
jgi:hypothetical protein